MWGMMRYSTNYFLNETQSTTIDDDDGDMWSKCEGFTCKLCNNLEIFIADIELKIGIDVIYRKNLNIMLREIIWLLLGMDGWIQII